MSVVEGMSTGLRRDIRNEAKGWVGSTALETSNLSNMSRIVSFSAPYKHLHQSNLQLGVTFRPGKSGDRG